MKTAETVPNQTIPKERRGLLSILRRRQHQHAAHAADCTALCCAKNGQTLCVRHLVGEDKECACLRDIGVREGAIVTVLRHGDPLLVRIGDARFGIGHAAAECILCHAHIALPSDAENA